MTFEGRPRGGWMMPPLAADMANRDEVVVGCRAVGWKRAGTDAENQLSAAAAVTVVRGLVEFFLSACCQLEEGEELGWMT